MHGKGIHDPGHGLLAGIHIRRRDILFRAENIQQAVSHICTDIHELGADPPDVIFITVKANANSLIALV